jgi:hypothetical protein
MPPEMQAIGPDGDRLEVSRAELAASVREAGRAGEKIEYTAAISMKRTIQVVLALPILIVASIALVWLGTGSRR